MVVTWERAYAGRLKSVGEAGEIFPHHELYMVFESLKRLGRDGWEEEKGNFGVPELFVSRKFGHEVYSLDGDGKALLESIKEERRVTQEIKDGLKREYPAE